MINTLDDSKSTGPCTVAETSYSMSESMEGRPPNFTT